MGLTDVYAAAVIKDFNLYEATSPEALREHAKRAELGITEIRPVVDTVIVRADPTK